MKRVRPRPSRWLAVWLAVFVTACSGPSDTDLLASAKSHLAQKDPKSAILQLKSALQQNPDSGEARYLLGKALLDTGDAVAASVELRKAAELKFDARLVAPSLASALLLQGEHRRIVDSYGALVLDDAAANAALKTTLAQAYMRLDKPDLANQALGDALAASPQYAPAKLMRARLAAGRQDFATALTLLEEATSADASSADAWLLKAEVQQHGTRDNAAALASYRKAVELRADLMPAHQGIVTLLLAAKDMAGAQAHVDGLKASQPKAPGTQLLDAQMAYLRQDWAATRAIAQPLVQMAPNNPIVLQLAGGAEFHLGALPQAENLLAQAVKIAPGLPLATQLLAQTYLRTGQPEKALDTLRPGVESSTPRPEALTLAGEAYLQTGDAKRAEAMFTRAAAANPGAVRARTALALAKIGRGDANTGLAELESMSEADGGGTADLALIASHLRRKDTDKALQAIAALERKQPQRALAANLRGRVLVLKQDAAGARASFERALALDPVYFPAVASLAALDLVEKKPAAARKHFDDLLQKEPANHRAMLALASLLARTGGSPQEIGAQITSAVKAAPSEAAPRLQLVNHHLAQGDAKAALAAAQDASTALPGNRDVVQALGRAQLAGGDFQQAVTSFNRLATLQPRSAAAPLGLADAYLGLKDYAGAERQLQRALELSPGLLVAQRGLIKLYTGDGRYTEALALARDVQKQRPAEAAGLLLEGEIELQRRRWDPALAVLRTAVQKLPSAETASRLHGALLAAGRADEAERFATTWLADHARDTGFRFHLADQALSRSDWALAESRYREVLRLQPEHALALNNVAWLLVKQGKPGALPLAEKATALAPGSLPLLDTLALALAADKQLPRALDLHRKTLERAPDDPGLRLTLARLYLQSGDKAQARIELDKLARLGKAFREQDEVSALLKQV